MNYLKRLFIAIKLPTPVKAGLSALEHPSPNLKWMNPEQLHITLYFLGNTNTAHIDKIKDIIRQNVAGLKSIRLKLSGIGLEKERMVWVRVSDSGEKLYALHENLKKAFINEKIGETPRGRIFQPHILLAKIKEGLGDQNEILELKKAFKTLDIEAKSIGLFESKLEPSGAKHTEIFDIEFGKTEGKPKILDPRTSVDL